MTAAPTDVSHYTYRVSWSPEDGEHVATCAEFPSLSWLAPSQGEALAGLVELVAGVVADLLEEGKLPPQPLAERPFSGRFNVRLAESLHRDLALRAAENGVSLNTYVVQQLSRSA